jgi:hypothetical protein
MEKIDRGEIAFHLITNLVVVSVIAFMSYEILKGINIIVK